MLFTAALTFHIIFAALLFGVPMGITRNCRTALAAGAEAFKVAAIDGKKRVKITGISGVLTFLSGVGLIFIKGGMGAVPKSYHMAMGLILVSIAVGIAVSRPAANKIHDAAHATPVDTAAGEVGIKRLAMGTGISHLLWVVLLVMMVNPF